MESYLLQQRHLRSEGRQGRLQALCHSVIWPALQHLVGFVVDLSRDRLNLDRVQLVALAGQPVLQTCAIVIDVGSAVRTGPWMCAAV